MNEKSDRKTYVIIALLGIAILGTTWIFSVYSHGGNKQKSIIEDISAEYIYENHPEVSDKISLTNNGANFRPKSKWITDQTASLPWWDGVWLVPYSVKGYEHLKAENGDTQFFMMFNRMGDKILFDGYKDNFAKGGIVLKAAEAKYNETVFKIFNDKRELSRKADEKNDFYDTKLIVTFVHPDSVTGGTTSPDMTENYNGPILDINKDYTLDELATEYGHLQFNFDGDEKTLENLYNRRLQVQDFIKDNNITFKDITIVNGMLYGAYNLTQQEIMSDDLKAVIGRKGGSIFENRNRVELAE